jgi:hypothetical protein
MEFLAENIFFILTLKNHQFLPLLLSAIFFIWAAKHSSLALAISLYSSLYLSIFLFVSFFFLFFFLSVFCCLFSVVFLSSSCLSFFVLFVCLSLMSYIYFILSVCLFLCFIRLSASNHQHIIIFRLLWHHHEIFK